LDKIGAKFGQNDEIWGNQNLASQKHPLSLKTMIRSNNK